MTLAQFRAEIAALLSLNVNDSAELALLDQWINEGVTYVVAEGQTKSATATIALTASVGDYQLDTAILRLLWLQTSALELQPAGPTEILRRRLNAASDSPQLYALDGANLLMVYPTPAAADSLTVYYVPRPATLSATAASPDEIPAEFHRLVSFYALWRGADYDDDQTSAQGSRYKQLLDDGVKDMRSRLTKKRGRRLPLARVTRRHRVQHRNDVYPG